MSSEFASRLRHLRNWRRNRIRPANPPRSNGHGMLTLRNGHRFPSSDTTSPRAPPVFSSLIFEYRLNHNEPNPEAEALHRIR